MEKSILRIEFNRATPELKALILQYLAHRQSEPQLKKVMSYRIDVHQNAGRVSFENLPEQKSLFNEAWHFANSVIVYILRSPNFTWKQENKKMTLDVIPDDETVEVMMRLIFQQDLDVLNSFLAELSLLKDKS